MRVRRALAFYATFTDLGLVKNKRNEKAAKFSVPLPKVRGIAEEEMFKVVKTGKTAKKGISDLLRFCSYQAKTFLLQISAETEDTCSAFESYRMAE